MKRSTKFLIVFLIALLIAIGLGFLFNTKTDDKSPARGAVKTKRSCCSVEQEQVTEPEQQVDETAMQVEEQ